MERREIGLKELAAIDGEGGFAVVHHVAETSPALSDALVEFCFGEIFSRAELSRRDRELMTVGMLAAMGGAEPQLRVHLTAALRCGVDPDELVAAAEHVAVYAGFPRALNALRETRAILEQHGQFQRQPSRRLTLGDHETMVTDIGTGAPLVLIHAIGLDRRMWRDVIPLLARHRRVIAYDLRGHGHAAAAPQPFSLERFADDLHVLLDVLGLDRAEIAGLSIGGAVAQCFALRHPERLAALTLICTTDSPQPTFRDRAAAAEAQGMAAQVAPTLTRWFTPAFLAENNWAVRYARDRVLRCGTADWAATWRALAEIDTARRLGEISCPTHLISGEVDPSTSSAGMRAMAAKITGARFSEIPGGPHMLSLEKPQELAAAMLAGN